MMAGSSTTRHSRRRLPFGAAPLAASALLLLTVACSDKKPAAPATSAPPPSAKSSMFQNLDKPPLPKPPSEEAPSGAPAALPSLAGAGNENPECRAFSDEEKAIRTEIEAHNQQVVAPASEKAEAAYDDFQACQEDPGCVGSLQVYSAKQSAYQAAKRAEEGAEKKLEELETRLHDTSQKIAAKCADPL